MTSSNLYFQCGQHIFPTLPFTRRNRLSRNSAFLSRNDILKIFTLSKGLVTPANGYVPEGKRTKVCRIWLFMPLKALAIRVWSLEVKQCPYEHRTCNGKNARMYTGCIPDNKRSIDGYHRMSNGLVPDKTEMQRMRTSQNVLPT